MDTSGDVILYKNIEESNNYRRIERLMNESSVPRGLYR